jgi:capsular exopolysaccharide synthesis family protein
MSANPLSPSPAPMTGDGIGPAAGRFTPLDPIRVVRQHARLLVAVAVVGVVLGVGLWFTLRRVSPEYTSEAKLLVTGGLDNPYEDPGETGQPKAQRLEGLRAFIKNQIILLRSDDVLSDAIKRQSVQGTRWYGQFNDPQRAREDLKQRLNATQVIGSTYIAVSVRGPFPEDLPKILDTVIDVYLDKRRLENDLRTSEFRKVFKAERERAEMEMQQVQAQLKQFTIENDLPNLESSNNEATIAYRDLSEQLSQLQMALQTARDSFKAMQSAQQAGVLTPSPDELAQVESDPAVASREERVRSLREQREVYLHRFGANHRAVLETDRQIMAAQQEKQREIERLLRERQAVTLDQLRKRVDGLEGQIAGMQPSLEESRARMRDLTQKLEEYRRIDALAAAALRQREKADELLNNVRIRNDRSDSEGVRKMISATDASLTFPLFSSVVFSTAILLEALALGLIFVKEMLDQRIKSPADVKLLPKADLLGVLPMANEDPLAPAVIENIVQKDPGGLLAESFRQIRTTMLHRAQGRKVILFVGAQAGGGVSSVVSNLAISLAYNGLKVLVIDANFRRPALHRLLEVRSDRGLVDVVRGGQALESALVRKTEPPLDVLVAGNTANVQPEILASSAMRELLTRARAHYDLVLIDAPPALLTSECMLLANQVDAAVLVVRAMAEKRGMISRLLRQFETQQLPVLGLVLNGVRSSAGGYFRQNYQDFYRYRKESAQDGGASAPGATRRDAAHTH